MTSPNVQMPNSTKAEALLPVVSDPARAPDQVFPGAQLTGDEQVDHFANEIRRNFRKSVEGIMQVARFCAEAKSSLDGVQLKRLIQRLPFSRTDFVKYAGIGSNPALFDERVQKSLPAKWTTIYPLRNLTTEEVKEAIDERVLNPKASRKEITAWVREHSGQRKKEKQRTAQNDARHDDLLRDLSQAFLNSSEIMAIWKNCPTVVRKRFGRDLGQWTLIARSST